MAEHDRDELIERLERANPLPAGATSGAVNSARATSMFAAIVDGQVRPLGWLASLRIRGWRRTPERLDATLDERLRSADPLPRTALAESGPTLRAELLFERLVSEAPVRPRRSRPTRRRLLVALVLTVGFVASAFGFLLAQRHVTNATFVSCYESASLSAPHVDLYPGPTSAEQACGDRVWSRGGFGPRRRPHLVGCVLGDGVEAVFPARSDAICGRLGLSVALSPTSHPRQVELLRIRLDHELDPALHCVLPAAAVSVARDELATIGLRGWSVQVGVGFSSERPCAQEILDTEHEIVYLDPVMRLGFR